MNIKQPKATVKHVSTTSASESSVTTIPRSKLHEAATWCAQRAAVGLHSITRRSLGDGFGILTYHRVTDRLPGLETPTVNVTPQRLQSQLAGLLNRGFEAWSLKKVLASWKDSTPIPTNVFVVTFDDGYENNLLHAVPILNELRIPATIFLATAYLDSSQPFPFDNWSYAGSDKVPAASWRPLTTAQCHTLMENELIELAAHTHTHDAFAGRTDEFRQDMATSLEILDRQFGIQAPTFSFPFGQTTPELIAAARESGVTCALSTRAERVAPSLDPYHWGRFTASDLDLATTLAAKLCGWYTPVSDLLRTLKQPLAVLGSRANGQLVTLSRPCFSGK